MKPFWPSRAAMKKTLPGTGSTPATQFTDLAPHYDELMKVVPYAAWAEYIQLLFQIANVAPQSILDCACGTGNVSFELASRSYDVTGVDISAAMIAKAQGKSGSTPSGTTLPKRFVEADLSSFNLGEKFDAATCLYDSFNYILEPEKLLAAFNCIASHIRHGGVFIFDMNAPWAFEANLFTQRDFNPMKNLHYEWHSQYQPSTRICEVTMQFKRVTDEGTQLFSEVHRERAYAREEVETMLAQSGWKLLKTYDAYTMNLPHDRSERWYFLAQLI